MFSVRHYISGSNNKTVYPWRQPVHCELLIDGHRFFPAILDAIEQAESYVLIEMYLVESGQVVDEFIEVLIKKAQQGVWVQLVFDGFGAGKLAKKDQLELAAAGIELFFYNAVSMRSFKRNLHRTHRKIIVIDGRIAFTGGAGLTDSFIGDYAWRETMIRVEGEVCRDWQDLFTNTLQHISDGKQSTLPSPRAEAEEAAQAEGNAAARVIYSNGGAQIELKRSLLKHIARADKTVWMATAYFIPSRKIRKALRKAAKQNKDVRLLLPGEVTDHPAVVHASRRYYSRLLRHGVRIFEYQGRFIHTKVYLVDDWCSIGSSNMDRWNLLWNLEANQEVRDEKFAAEVKTMMAKDFAHSKEITYEAWKQRSVFQRFREWLWGKVDLWITSWRAGR